MSFDPFPIFVLHFSMSKAQPLPFLWEYIQKKSFVLLIEKVDAMFFLSLHHIMWYDPTTQSRTNYFEAPVGTTSFMSFTPETLVNDNGNVLPTALSIFSLPKNLFALYQAASVCVRTPCVTIFLSFPATTYERVGVVRWKHYVDCEPCTMSLSAEPLCPTHNGWWHGESVCGYKNPNQQPRTLMHKHGYNLRCLFQGSHILPALECSMHLVNFFLFCFSVQFHTCSAVFSALQGRPYRAHSRWIVRFQTLSTYKLQQNMKQRKTVE